MMTIVTPMAIRPTTEICRTTLNRFRGCRKASVRNVIPTNIAIKINTIAYFRMNALNNSRLRFLSTACGVAVLAMLISFDDITAKLPLNGHLLLPHLGIQTMAHSSLHNRLLRSIFTLKYPPYPALVHHQDSVAHAQNLRQF